MLPNRSRVPIRGAKTRNSDLEDGNPHTPEELGRIFAVARERIRQIEVKLPRKLCHPSLSNLVRAFLEALHEAILCTCFLHREA